METLLKPWLHRQQELNLAQVRQFETIVTLIQKLPKATFSKEDVVMILSTITSKLMTVALALKGNQFNTQGLSEA